MRLTPSQATGTPKRRTFFARRAVSASSSQRYRSSRLGKIRSAARSRSPATVLFAQIRSADIGVLRELGRGSRQRDGAGLEHVPSGADGGRPRGALLDQENRHPLAVDGADRVEDLLDEDGSQPHGRLVGQEEPWGRQ